MGFKCGIVGLPNVGKSTLFNALTKAGIEAANYPFCTIEPNIGVVPVPDIRLKNIVAISNSKEIIPPFLHCPGPSPTISTSQARCSGSILKP